jgi:hypothetical protein
MSFRGHFLLLLTPWDPSTGFFEPGRFCILPTETDDVNVMDLVEISSEDVHEGVERVWRLNIQPSMTNEAPNGIVCELHFVRFGRTPSEACIWASKHSWGGWVACQSFPLSSLVLVGLGLERPHADNTRISSFKLAKTYP